TAFAPSPNETFNQQKQEDENRDESANRQTGERDRERHQKNCFHVENQQNDRVEVILGSELNLCFADRFDAAFVDRILLRAWLWWLKEFSPQPRQSKRQQRKRQSYAGEDDDEEIRVRSHSRENLI